MLTLFGNIVFKYNGAYWKQTLLLRFLLNFYEISYSQIIETLMDSYFMNENVQLSGQLI